MIHRSRHALRALGTMLVTALLLAACGTQAETPEDSFSSIRVEGPMTIATGTVGDRMLKLLLVKGRYYEDWNLGPMMGGIWEGDFELALEDASGQTLSTKALNRMHDSDPMAFNDRFEITTGDCNGDGCPDFLIGQYGSSNGNNYQIYTIGDDNEIRELGLKDQTYLSISEADGRYATRLEMVDGQTFRVRYYNNVEGMQQTDWRWNGTQFEKLVD